MERHPPSIIVTGPTASGKSRLGAEVARHFGVPLISLDSMKVYRGMDIGTAKPAAAVVASLPMLMVDIRDPWEAFSVGDYFRELRALVAELPRPWVFCGGTAFYLHSLTQGIHTGPPPDEGIRQRLTGEAHADGTESLHRRLQTIDPPAAERIHATDLRRVIRALEVYELCGEPISALQARKRPFLPDGSFLLLGIERQRDELYERVNQRVARMFDEGWIEEVARLLAAHDPPWGQEASQSIGYTLIRQALERSEDPKTQLTAIQSRTRKFARSQLTWFRKMPIEFLQPDTVDLDVLKKRVEAYDQRGESLSAATGR